MVEIFSWAKHSSAYFDVGAICVDNVCVQGVCIQW